eukprot:6187653-Pleurochrysis_carterae.AAC.3
MPSVQHGRLTSQPLTSFSSSRRKHASKSRRPGLSSFSRIRLILTVRPDRVASANRSRRCDAPSYESIPHVRLNCLRKTNSGICLASLG